MTGPPPILAGAGIRKTFPGVLAVDGAALTVEQGEVHALVGENGAGKSTLIRVFTGAHRPEEGTLELEGLPVRFPTPATALRAGIAAIYQEGSLVPDLTVRENLFLGRERPRAGLFLRVAEERRRATEALGRLGAGVDPEAPVRGLDVARRQLAEIARALLADARLLILDEPTAALTPREAEALFGVLGELRRRGIGILFISHRLEEVFQVADRVTVMRDGRTLGSWPAAELTRPALIERMVGRPLDREFPPRERGVNGESLRAAEGFGEEALPAAGGPVRKTLPAIDGPGGELPRAVTGSRTGAPAAAAEPGGEARPAAGEPGGATPWPFDGPGGGALLAVSGLAGGAVRAVSFTLRRGEILGVAGLVGAGRTEMARLLCGAVRPAAGRVELGGRAVAIRSPRQAIRLGLCLLSEDRQREGLIPGLSARDNFALPNLGRWSTGGWIRRREEDAAFRRGVEALTIRLSGPEQPAGHLSGGNQQKLLLARWLERDARVIVFDEPTRGVDVGARYEIYCLIRGLAARGKGVILISSDLPEVLGMSDRILVMREGRLAGEIAEPQGATQEEVLALAVG